MKSRIISRDRITSLLTKPFSTSGSQKGMTLLEIIIVVALLGALMAMLVKNLTTQSENAQIDITKSGMAGISQNLQMYKLHNNRYPTTEQGLDALVSAPGDAPRWRGPYIEKDKLKDPWGTPYDYKSDGKTYEIISAGPDLEFGTAKDIHYPPQENEGGGGGE